jgi:hypothetical protein
VTAAAINPVAKESLAATDIAQQRPTDQAQSNVEFGAKHELQGENNGW